MAKEEFHGERRQHPRIKKNFILSYYEAGNPSAKKEISQLKNISVGGICFVTPDSFRPNTKMIIELKTPYLAGTTHLEGTVLESHEKVVNVLYETRLIFEKLTPQAEAILIKIVEYFKDRT